MPRTPVGYRTATTVCGCRLRLKRARCSGISPSCGKALVTAPIGPALTEMMQPISDMRSWGDVP